MMDTGLNPTLGFIEFERRVLSSDALDAFGFTIVNDLISVMAYRQAVFWRPDKGVVAISGVVQVNPQSPFALYLAGVFKAIAKKPREPGPLDAKDLPKDLAEQWDEWLPGAVFVVPLATGIVLISRQEPFTAADEAILGRLQLTLSVTERALGRRLVPQNAAHRRRRLLMVAIVAAIALVMLLPIRDSVLAPAEMVARNPSIVRSPMDGVIEEVFVEPNELVSKDQPLFSLDLTTLVGKLEIARQEQATSEAQYREMAQAQLFDPKAKVQVALLKAKVSEKAATVTYLDSLITQGRVLAPREGVAVFDDPTNWIGRPVSIGEKVMQVAATTDTEIEAWVALGDIGMVKVGAPLRLFLNTDPMHPLAADITTVAYEAVGRPDGSLMYRIRARMNNDAPPVRIGLKGVARINGDSIALGWWLLRKPVAFFRQRTGL